MIPFSIIFRKLGFVKNLFLIGFDSIVGRISLNNSDILPSINYSQAIEQVWNCSHREIEKYNASSNVMYLRASREGWGRHYSIEKLSGFSADEKRIAIHQFVEIVKSIEVNREKIECFSDYLKELHIDELCLEYMLSDGQFRFIDWDTKDDKKVIDSVFGNVNR